MNHRLVAIHASAQHAIEAELDRRGYQVTVGPVHRAYGIAEIRIPVALEAYVAETRCTVHAESPCLWVDWAFRRPDGSFRVVLQNDLLRLGMMLEDSVRTLFAELAAEQRAMEGH